MKASPMVRAPAFTVTRTSFLSLLVDSGTSVPMLEQLHALAVDGDFELFVFAVAAVEAADAGAHRDPGDEIFAVGREVMMDQHAAARAERQAVDVIFLRIVFADVVDLAGRLGFMAEREAADFSGGGNVAFDQRRRDVQAAGHVVEAVAGIVGGQVSGGIDIEREQVVDGVRVFGPVDAVDAGRGEFRFGGGSAVELILQSDGQRFVCGGRGTRKALRRHHAGAKFANDFFPRLGLVADMGEIHFVELKTGGFELLVVAGDAVLIEDGALRGQGGLGWSDRRKHEPKTGDNQDPCHCSNTTTQPKTNTTVPRSQEQAALPLCPYNEVQA